VWVGFRVGCTHTSWYQERMGQIQTPPTSLGLTCTPSSWQMLSKNFSLPVRFYLVSFWHGVNSGQLLTRHDFGSDFDMA